MECKCSVAMVQPKSGVGEEPEIQFCPLHKTAPDLLKACKRALPYLADHIGMTLDEGPGDRLAYDLVEAAIAKAEPSQ